MLRTNASTLVEFSVGQKVGRTIVQALPFVADRRHISAFESANEQIEFRDLWVELPQIKSSPRVWDPISGSGLRTEQTAAGLMIYLPPICEHFLCVVEG